MCIPQRIYILKGMNHFKKHEEIASHDVKSLQIVLTKWLRADGNGFIFRLG